MENWETWLEVLMQLNHEQNCIAKVFSFGRDAATNKGDNYMSDMKRVKMEVILKSGKKCKKSVIIKGLPASAFHQGMLKDWSLFSREITMYRDVVSSMEDLLNEFGDYTEPMWPKMIGCRPNDLLIMNDLSQCGYIMADRLAGFDLEHCLLVMRSLAKFHALSVIAMDRGLISMDIFVTPVLLHESTREMHNEIYKSHITNLIHIIETSWEPKWKPIAEKLRKNILPAPFDLQNKMLQYDPNRFNVMNHGDCWVNNMMFKYGLDSVTPISVKFVDLQMTFINSPALDLQFFMQTSLNHDVRMNHQEQLLKAYYDMLVQSLELYQYKGTIITYDQLIKEYKEANIFGLITALFFLPIIYRDDKDENFPEFEENLQRLKNKEKQHIPPCTAPAYIAVMRELLERIDKDKSLDIA